MRRSERVLHPPLNAESARSILDYDPETGAFAWKISRGNLVAGRVAGSVSKSLGYRFIEYQNRPYLAHRLAFLFMTGEWPAQEVDHRDGVKSNNAWKNLRDASRTLNAQNMRTARGASGFLGVHWAAHANRWRAGISVAGKRKNLGYFPTSELAHGAYVAAKRQLHEGCTL